VRASNGDATTDEEERSGQESYFDNRDKRASEAIVQYLIGIIGIHRAQTFTYGL
jgi:hypothetical protein